MDGIDIGRAAQILKALGDPKRLQIALMLSGCEKCACVLLEQFQISQPTLSHHMRILCESGLVGCRREGKWCHYSLRPEAIETLRNLASSLKGEGKGDGGCGCGERC